MSVATIRRSRASPRNFGITLDPRVTHPPQVLSVSPVTSTSVVPRAVFSRSPEVSLSMHQSFFGELHDRAPVADLSHPLLRLEASRVLQNLWLGGELDTYNLDALKANNIRHILNVAEECHPSRSLASQCTFEDIVPQTDECCVLGNESTKHPLATTIQVLRCADAAAACSAGGPQGRSVDKQFTYLYIPLKDSLDADAAAHIPMCVAFIQRALLRNEGILVHCRAGVSRSATMVIAYLMLNGVHVQRPGNCSFDEAFEIVHRKRPIVNPNLAFGSTLRALENKVP